MNYLFVCTAGRLRSATAKTIFKNTPGFVIKSAGTDKWIARQPLNAKLMAWADKVFVMQQSHAGFIGKHYKDCLHKVICLDIPDIYDYMDKDLIDLLKLKMTDYFKVTNQKP